MKKVEHAQGQGFGARGHDQNQRFGVPKTEQVGQVRRGRDLQRHLRAMDISEQTPLRGAIQPRRVRQIAVNRPQRMRHGVPAHGQVADRPCQKNDAHTLIEWGERPAIESDDQPNAQQHARNQKRHPGERTDRPAPRHQGDDNDQNRGNRGKGAPSIPPKTPVIGAIARKGNVVAQVIEDTDRWTMERFVRLTVNPNVSLVATDEHAGYARLNQLGFSHGTVKHKAGEYSKETVHGNVHTASLDSFWSLLKRGIMGSFHKVSKDYLPLYLNEFSFRHNHRQDPDVFDRVLESC